MIYSLPKWVNIIGINVLVITLILCCLEIGCRLTKTPFKGRRTFAEESYARFDEELGWSYLPKKSLNYRFGYQKQPIAMHFNKDSIRIPEANFEFDPTKPSVLFVGGSFTMGHGLFFEETFVGQFSKLEKMLLQVVNLGVQGYGTDQALLKLKKSIQKFDTKLVVYTFIHEHVERNGNYDRRMLHPDMRFVGTKPLFKMNKKGKLYLAKKPVVYKEYRNSWLLDALIIRVGSEMGIFPPKPTDVTEALIREMKNTSERDGARFVVINWYRDNDEIYHIIQNLKGIDIIGTKDIIPDWDHFRIPGDGHPNQEAHKHITHIIYEYFLRNKAKILGG